MTRSAILTVCVVLVSLFVGAPAAGHEVRPAYLELRETVPGQFAALWKTPMRGEFRLDLAPRISGDPEPLLGIETRRTEDAAIQTWSFRAPDHLRTRTITIDGLGATMTDALVRVEFADGTTWVQRLTPSAPSAAVPARQSAWSVSAIYLGLGVEHILLGADHLLFVLALLLITKGTLRVVKTVTAFTLAHSITLALASLGVVHIPPPPVEAVIALSIVFVAAEIIRDRRGQLAFTARAPWLVAFAFGLLHGLGFAGALNQIGLPQGHIPLALLFFNLGVEAGQLLFVAAVLSLAAAARRIRIPSLRWVGVGVGVVPPYAIGSIAMFWVIQRVAAF